ncbi:MAG: hypothetical protein H6734_25205 [Alphaproteobacteria bacterium]|nr:hypothetical protein [Alphaproteobacteria bacterium]
MTRIALTASLLVGSTAFAQDALPPQEELVMQDGAFVIEGKVQKPEVVVVVDRKKLDQGFDLGLDEDFLDRIVQAAAEPPF